MKKLPFAMLFAMVFSLGAQADDTVGAVGLPPAAEPAAQAADAKAAHLEQGATVSDKEDVIDLDEVDDSAEAAKRPSVKFIAKQGGAEAPAPAAPETASAPAEQEKPPAAETAAPAAASPEPPAHADAKPASPAPAAAIPAPPAPASPFSASEKALVDISCDDATLADILRQFRKTTGANIISGDSTNLMRRVSVNLNHVPWLQALQSILNSRGFRLEPRDGIYFVSEDKQLDPLFTRAYTLNHASADELAKLFNTTYATKNAQGVPIQPVATSFPGANVVVVTATEKILRDCETIIKSVDKPSPQVYIEARFIQVNAEALHKLGMDWSSLDSWGVSMGQMKAGWEYNNGRVGNYWSRLTNSSTSDSSSKSADSANSTLSVSRTYEGVFPKEINAAPGAGRTAESMAWRNARGFSGQLSVDAFRLAMSAFETLKDARIFSNPKIIVANGKEAKVDMTTKYPNVMVDSNYTGQNQNSLSVSTKLDVIPGEDKQMFAKEAFFSWGIMLTVKPRISPDGLINVEIIPTISDQTSWVEVKSTQESETPYTRYPVIDVKRLATSFTMKDGSTAVIGGLSMTTEEDVDSGIPYLRKIPWIGPKLFGQTSRQKVQNEIIVFVTVGIANPVDLPADIGLPKNAIMGREYVEGTRLEPGDRSNAAGEFTKFDLRPLDERGDEQAKSAPENPAADNSVSDESAGSVVIKLSGDAPESRPESVSNVDGSVTVRRVPAADQPAAAAPAQAPAAPEPLVNKDTAKSVDDLLSE